ncbi:hypothetical protein [Enterococcus sp. AZ109]
MSEEAAKAQRRAQAAQKRAAANRQDKYTSVAKILELFKFN